MNALLLSSALGGWRRSLNFALAACLCWSWGCATPARPSHELQPAPTTVDSRPGVPATTGQGSQANAMDQPAVCDDKPVERVGENWSDGSPKSQEEIVTDEDGNEILHGLTTHYWPNGQKRLEMEYNCGVQDGPRLTWYKDGSLWSQGEFANGRDHGHWVVWYPDGSKSQEFTMVHGAWHGTHTMWDYDGHKRREVHWVQGMRQGTLRIWDEENNLVSEAHYVDGIEQPTPRSRVGSAE